MNQSELLNILDSKLQRKDGMKRILINGAWGIGKSYLWEQFKKKATIGDYKTIYISLFGAVSADLLLRKIKTQYILVESKAESSILKKTAKLVLDNKALKAITSALSTKHIGMSFDPISLIPLTLGEDYIVCFDDLERISEKINMNEVLGLIESIALKSNVIVIANYEEIIEKKIFDSFKEKVIDRTYSLSHIEIDIVTNIVKCNLNKSDLRSAVGQFFISISINSSNLRTLIKMINFVNEVSTIVEIDDRISNLCCALVAEDVLGADLDLEGILKFSFGDKNSIYFKYALSNELQSIISEVLSFYKYNRMDKKKIKSFLNPELKQNQELLYNLQKAWLFNEEFIIQSFDNVNKQLKTKNYMFFESCEILIQIIFYIKFYNEKLSLNLDVQEINESALCAIDYLVDLDKDMDKLLTLEIFKMHFSEYPHHAENLLDHYKYSIIQQKSKYDTDKYLELFNQKIYKECQQIIKSNPTIIPQIITSLELITDQHCEYDFLYLVIAVISYSRFDQNTNSIVEDKMNDLLNSVTDKLIRSRIEMVIKNG